MIQERSHIQVGTYIRGPLMLLTSSWSEEVLNWKKVSGGGLNLLWRFWGNLMILERSLIQFATYIWESLLSERKILKQNMSADMHNSFVA